MRQRKAKNLEERLEKLRPYLVEDPTGKKGKWNRFFENKVPLYVEIGCGKGQFITGLAEKEKKGNFLGVEGQRSALLYSLEKIDSKELTNVFFIGEYMTEPEAYFSPGEVSGIYLNFSDPWPKERHAKRRLTHERFLRGYKEILTPGGCVEFKTDNDELYDFTLDEIKKCGFEILESTNDLHGSPLAIGKVMTEYEEKFSSRGKNINYVKWR